MNDSWGRPPEDILFKVCLWLAIGALTIVWVLPPTTPLWFVHGIVWMAVSGVVCTGLVLLAKFK